MAGDTVTYHYIGFVRSEHVDPEKTPIQPVYAENCLGRAEILPQFEEGLRDLEGFSHLYLVYHLHRAEAAKLLLRPYLQDVERGVFATRAPCRPNAIGLSIVRLLGREGCILRLGCVDLLDGTPLLDIKPYATRFDSVSATRNGWQESVDDETADRRGRRAYSPSGVT